MNPTADPTKIARAADPITSHLAAHEIIASGKRVTMQNQCLDAVIAYESWFGVWPTCSEVAEWIGVHRSVPSKRLPEIPELEQGPPRRGANGRLEVVWMLKDIQSEMAL